MRLWLAVILLVIAGTCATAGQSANSQDNPRFDNEDLDKKYPNPTVIDIAPFTLIPGQAPRIHIHIEWRKILYNCMASSNEDISRAQIEKNVQVELREDKQYVYVRRTKKDHWVRLKLLNKSTLFSL